VASLCNAAHITCVLLAHLLVDRYNYLSLPRKRVWKLCKKPA